MRTLPLVLLLGCTAQDVVVGDLQEVATVPFRSNRDLDILFVVDNSPSMADKQVSLADNFPLMMDVLSTLDGGLPNLHIGVVTSDLGTASSTAEPAPQVAECVGRGGDGVLQHASPDVTGAFITDVANPDGTRTTNYTGALRDVFSQNALVGDVGCGFEQHLGAMRAALDGHADANAGFLRDDANLAVVILADEDDCTAHAPGLFDHDPSHGPLDSYRCTKYGVVCDGDDPDNPHADQTNCKPRPDSPLVDDVQPYTDFLAALKRDPRMLLVSTIIGAPDPFSTLFAPPPAGGSPQMLLAHSCTFAEPDGSLAVADPAVRLAAFAGAFPGRSTQTSICSADLSAALQQIGTSAKRLIGDPCLTDTPLVDTCQVTAVPDSHPEVVDQLPACASGTTSQCYEIVADAAACPYTTDHLRVHVEHTDQTPGDTWFHVRCQLPGR